MEKNGTTKFKTFFLVEQRIKKIFDISMLHNKMYCMFEFIMFGVLFFTAPLRLYNQSEK